MSMFRCETCGKTFVEDRSCEGMSVRCPECHNLSREIPVSNNDFVCKDCGLSCLEGEVHCPACGGDVVQKSTVGPTEYEIQEQKEAIKAESFWENFFWGLFLPNSGIWLLI